MKMHVMDKLLYLWCNYLENFLCSFFFPETMKLSFLGVATPSRTHVSNRLVPCVMSARQKGNRAWICVKRKSKKHIGQYSQLLTGGRPPLAARDVEHPSAASFLFSSAYK
jgi:hypothetical protein